MSNGKAPFEYEIILTADGSPTLSLWGGEKMHSLDGALSESLYIYGPAIGAAIENGGSNILSMGLGIGYNEIISHCHFHQKQMTEFHILSFEKVPELRTFFKEWIMDLSTPLNECFDNILKQITDQFSIDHNILKQELKTSLNEKRLLILESLESKNPSQKKYQGILYDAFSSNTDDYLWDENHIENFVDQYCDPHKCWFSTYAATGGLKRALKNKGFLLEKKAGFGKKRESTFATRSRRASE